MSACLRISGDVLACDHLRGGAQVFDARIGAGADEDAVDGNIHDGRAGFQTHVNESARGGFLVVGIAEGAGVGHAIGDAGDHAGIGAPGDLRRDVGGVSSIVVSNFAPGSVVSCFHRSTASAESFAARDERAAFEVSESGFVRRDHSGARAAFDGHVADGHAAVHGKFADGFAGVFDHVTGAAADADLADDARE